MEIQDYGRILKRFWWVVLLTTVIGAGVGYGSLFVLYTPKYESTARLFVTTQAGTSVGEAYQNNLFSQERVVSYAGLATSEQVAARAVDQLKSSLTPDELREKITAAPQDKTVLLDVTATDSDPANAQTYANAVADQLVQLVSELETSRRGGTPAAAAIVVDGADYPSSPSGPSLWMRILLGASGGLAVGLIIAILLGVLDTRLRRRDRVAALSDSGIIGSLPVDPAREQTSVIGLSSGGLAAERIRELRTNLQFARVADGGRPRVIAVTSPSRQEGRSTAAIDLAASFAETGRRVVLVDGDLRKPALAGLVGLSEAQRGQSANRGFSTVLSGQHTVAEAVVEGAGNAGFALLPAGPVPNSGVQLWGSDSADEVLDELARNYDYVIIDTPPLDSCTDGALAAALGVGAVVLARLGKSKTASLRKALEDLKTAHAETIGVVTTFETGHKRELSRDKRERDRRPEPSQSADPATEAISTPVRTQKGAPTKTESSDGRPATGRQDFDAAAARHRGARDLSQSNPDLR